MPKLFISSTSEDLEPYRNAARDAAILAGFFPVMMEYFTAQGRQPPYQACMEKVDGCDVVVAIVAHRYGWVPPDQPGGGHKSITWLECERANEKEEVLAFLVDEKQPWLAEHREAYRVTKAIEDGTYTPELAEEAKRNVAALREFKQWLSGLGVRATFTSPESLKTAVLGALFGRPVPQSDPGKYLQSLRDQTAWIDIRGLQVGTGKAYRFPIDDLYIPLKTAMSGEVRGSVLLEEALRRRRLVIVGDPGAGKTTFLRKIAYGLCQNPERGFPIFIRIAELEEHIANCRQQHQAGAPTTRESPEWLAHFLQRREWGLDAEFFERKLSEDSTVVLLDGLDETPNRVARESMARLFEKATGSYGKCLFVVTTRPQAYAGQSTLAGFEEVRIDDLEPEGIERFLEHWSRCLYSGDPAAAEAHRKELVDALRARVEIRRMARNPVMLTALAVVHWNERRLPEQRADLYESILTWLARSREKKPDREPSDRCLALLAHLALGMQNQPKGRLTQISRGPAAEIIAPQFRGIARDKQLPRAQSFLDQEEVDSGIVVSRGSEVRFWHLTFQEHLAARAIAGLPEADQQELLLDAGRLYRPEWREVVLLLAGTLLVRQGSEKVDGLFRAVLEGLKPEASLAERARCAGLLGAILRDLRPLAYHAADPRYQEMLGSVLDIFDAEKSAGVSLQERLEAAEALGQAGDPRLREDNWVTIPAGTFLMGAQRQDPAKPNYDPIAFEDESPVHEVYLDAYRIGRYPVTVEEYARFLDDEGYRGRREQPEDWADQLLHPNRPVVSVTWDEAAAYCAWAGGRLPTEAEWERAARGSVGRKYPWGNEAPDPSRANYDQTRVGLATPVGVFPRGMAPEGIHDLAGNVWEWVADWYGEDCYGKSPRGNPRGPAQGETRVLRGGSWYYFARSLRASHRGDVRPESRYPDIGFRCVRDAVS
ncbi:MAG: SUMF1/EgtB/PvdO family nonheme iron enzyme [Bryobacteraceae bacterium]|jgi:formylglycine-generating enzyme required for sulfatase activity